MLSYGMSSEKWKSQCPDVKYIYQTGSHSKMAHDKTEFLQVSKTVKEEYSLSPYLFNLYAEDILRKAGLEENQCGFKNGRNINNLHYVDDTTLITENANDLQALVIKGQGAQCEKKD